MVAYAAEPAEHFLLNDCFVVRLQKDCGVIRKNTGFAKKKWYFDFSLQPTKTMLVFNEAKPNSWCLTLGK